MNESSEDGKALDARPSDRGWFRFSPIGTLVGMAWLALGGVIALDASGASDPGLAGTLRSLALPAIVVGVVTTGLQLRGRWLAAIGVLGILFDGIYLLFSLGFMHFGSPVQPSLLGIVAMGAFLLVSLAAVGAGLARDFSWVGTLVALTWLASVVVMGFDGVQAAFAGASWQDIVGQMIFFVGLRGPYQLGLLLGLATFALQPRGGWLVAVGVLGVLFGGLFLLVFLSGGQPSGALSPRLDLVTVAGLAAFFLASLVAIGSGRSHMMPEAA